MAVARKGSSTENVSALAGSVGRGLHSARRVAAKLALRAAGAHSFETLSANFFPSGLNRRISSFEVDVVHLHWIGLEMLQIEEVGRIRQPLVWTMHDEWFALGLEHYATIGRDGDARGAILKSLDRSVRRRKELTWKACEPEVVCPSRWLAEQMRASDLVAPPRLHVISNTVPLDIFRPSDRAAARKQLGLPLDRPVVGMGALTAVHDPRKGYAYLREALAHIAGRNLARPPIVLVFGSRSGDELSVSTHFAGTVTDDGHLSRLYSAMDVFVCPSRQENLPNTIAEALACGIPTVAFDIGGIPDLVSHGKTGYLAKPFDTCDLAEGILSCIDGERQKQMSVAARAHAERMLDGSRIAAQYLAVFRAAVDRCRRGAG
jgi:glycosyltransferase involved in cell wall biosynthesis